MLSKLKATAAPEQAVMMLGEPIDVKAAEIATDEDTAIVETMTEDANATVRDEAKRYRSERAKRGK